MQSIDKLKIGETTYGIASKYDGANNDIAETYATKTYVDGKVSDLVGSAPETLDTLNELAAALGEDPNFATTISTEIGKKLDKVEGKGLSSNDFTNELKQLLESIPNTISGLKTDVASKYTKPSNGITKEDLSKEVLESLDKADTAIQDISSKLDTETFDTTIQNYALKTLIKEIPTSLPASDVYLWAKEETKPTYTKEEIGLDKVDNTSDKEKPVSDILLNALDKKVDKVDGKGLSTNDYTNEEMAKITNLQSELLSLKDAVDLLQGSEDLLSYGILFDSTVADPHCTRIGNPLLHKLLPIQSLYKGCVVKDGVLQYYLDPNDWSKKQLEEGQEELEASVLDGTDGDVCVETPTFYLKCTTDGNITTVRESLYKIDSDYKEIKGAYVDAYRGVVNSNKLRSVVNTTTAYRGGGGSNTSRYDTYLSTDKFRTCLGKPTTNVSRANFRTYARSAGKELMSYDQYKAIFYWNYVIEYANFNSQEDYNAELTSDGYRQGGLGKGLTTWDWSNWANYINDNPITPCGYGNDIGNFTGVKDIVIPRTRVSSTITISSKTFQMPRWRGFDNPFGDIWTILDGCVLSSPSMYIILNKDNYTDNTRNISYDRVYNDLPTSEGYVKAWQLGEYADIAPKTLGGSSTTYMCDMFQVKTGTDAMLPMIGGGIVFGDESGLGYLYTYYTVSEAYAYIGARGILSK